MREKKWIEFPHDTSAFHYKGAALATHWARLHSGDHEAFPTAETLAERIEIGAVTMPAKKVVEELQDAWRGFHGGDFHRAHDLGKQLGLAGFAVAIKAITVYASYLETDDHRAHELLLAASQQAEAVAAKLPHEANAHYLYALALGRYSQRVSVVDALSRGFAPKFEHALQHALRIEPKHADAHIAYGLFHAEVINKLGSLVGGLTYGASSGKAIEHFRKAVKLCPDAPVCRLEYAHGLRLIDRDANAAEIDDLLERAIKCKPADALEMLDRERAKKLAEEV
jgi:hypothetical protein